MHPVVTLALKDLRLLTRDKFSLFWILAFPLMFALLFGAIFGGGGDQGRSPLPVAVVDEDHSPRAQQFLAGLEGKKDTLEVRRLSRQEARDQVRKGDLVAYIALQPGFGKSPGLLSGQAPPLEMGIDPRRRAEAGMLQGLVMEVLFKDFWKQFPGPREGGGTHGPPMRIPVEEVAREGSQGPSAFEITFPSAILWGVMGCAAAFAISIVIERVTGTFLRLRIAPLSAGQVLAGKGLACFLAIVVVAGLLLTVGRLGFGVRLEDPLGLALGIVCLGACFVGMMMLLATVGKTEQAVAGAGWGTFTILAMFGGGMVPLMVMPSWMAVVSNFSPVKWGILALEGAIWRGYSLGEMLLPCGILVGVGLACFALGVRNLARGDA